MKKLLFFATLFAVAQAVAQNPFITHMYTADPTARVHEGKLYVYPSTDDFPYKESGRSNFVMPGYHVFSLERGSTWRDHGWILEENDVPWGVKNIKAMWAPDCIEKDGKYYFFYPAKPAGEKTFKRIGMGVSDSPTGPFRWEENYIKDVEGIDPGLLLDDDNKAYLFHGSGHTIKVAPLSADMTKITKKPIEVEGLPAGFKEGAFPIKVDSVYYLTFAHIFNEEGFTLGYATSDKPMGPYQYQGKIMDNIGNGTNHHSIVKYNGRWILFYHNWAISGFRKLRSICADYMEFNPNGTIKKVVPTLRGIGAPMPGDTIQIDRYNAIHDAQTAFVTGGEPLGWMVCETKESSNVIFNDVDFAEGKSTKMQARIACGQRMGFIEVRKDTPEGELIAKFTVRNTGGWDKWQTVESEILSPLKGKHNICVSFKGDPGATKIANLNWLLINE